MTGQLVLVVLVLVDKEKEPELDTEKELPIDKEHELETQKGPNLQPQKEPKLQRQKKLVETTSPEEEPPRHSPRPGDHGLQTSSLVVFCHLP